MLVRIVALAAALAAPVVAFAGEKSVRLDIEGAVQAVQTYAADANELLDRVGIEAEPNDSVSPAGGLDGDSTVKVRRSKTVALVIDGESRDVQAHGLTVGEALSQLGLTPGSEDFVQPAPDVDLTDGMEIVVRNAVLTKVRVDGVVRDVVSNGGTVGDLLDDAGIELGSSDFVRPTIGTRPEDGMSIRVVRVSRITTDERVSVPFRHIDRPDPELERGVRRLEQAGAEGTLLRRYSVILEDGERVSSRVVSEEVVREPRDHIVRVGTSEPAFESSGGSQTGVASWFEADGLVAAHRTLPIGTVVRVTNRSNGRSVSVRINQRGPTVEDRIIDLSDDAFREVEDLGAGTFEARIEW